MKMPSKFAKFDWIGLTHLTRTDEQQRKWRRGHYVVRGDSWANKIFPYPTRHGMKIAPWGRVLKSQNTEITVKRRAKISKIE